MKNAIITGGSSGLGLAITKALLATSNWRVFNLDTAAPVDLVSQNLTNITIDVTSEFHVKAFFSSFLSFHQHCDCLINNVGINCIGMLEDFAVDDWDRLLDTNARSIFMMTKYALPSLDEAMKTKESAVVLNIVSNAAHVPMTASCAYNASKGAAHIMTKQLARELTKRHGITVFGIAPNKMSHTGMSNYIDNEVCRTRGWTMEQAQEYQRQSLLVGEETPPEVIADLITYLLSSQQANKYLSGCIIPYGV